jgi:hypothetical protein
MISPNCYYHAVRRRIDRKTNACVGAFKFGDAETCEVEEVIKDADALCATSESP